MTDVRIGIIGYGKIAADAHVPAIAAVPGFALTAVSSPHVPNLPGLATFTDHRAMLASGNVDAVAICAATQFHYDLTRDCLDAGVDVLLEKPPAATLGAFEALIAQAAAKQRVLFAAWHSRFAAGVEAARAALAGRTVTRLDIVWHEDVRRWHPGQQWIWTAGGFGVFDPGINALSIATQIVPQPLILASAELDFPANRDAPIAARLAWAGLEGDASFDWTGTGAQAWTVSVASNGPPVVLTEGGARLSIGGIDQPLAATVEYEGVYRRFADLLAQRHSDADAAPLRLAADAFLVGKRNTVAAFVE